MKIIYSLLVLALSLGSTAAFAEDKKEAQPGKMMIAQGNGGFQVTSPSFINGGQLPNKHVFKGMGCEGDNISPALSWNGAPDGTKSYAITVYDPDAPTGSGWWHWSIYNIPASITAIKEGEVLPEAGAAKNDFGTTTFGGACPPEGDKPHRYILTVYALKTEKMDIPADASSAMAGFYINANKLAEATLTATYGR